MKCKAQGCSSDAIGNGRFCFWHVPRRSPQPAEPDARTAALVAAARDVVEMPSLYGCLAVNNLRAALQPFEDAAKGRGTTP